MLEKAFPYMVKGEQMAKRGYNAGKEGLEALIQAIESNPKLAAGAAGAGGLGAGAMFAGGRGGEDDEYEQMIRQARALRKQQGGY